MKFSIRTRLAFSFAVFFGVLIVLFSGSTYYFLWRGLEKELKKEVSHVAVEIFHEFDKLPYEAALKEMDDEAEEFQSVVRIHRTDGTVVKKAGAALGWDSPLNNKMLTQIDVGPTYFNERINGKSHLVLTQSVVLPEAGRLVIQVAKSRKDINRIKERVVYCLNVGTPLVLLFSIFVGLFLSKKALYPVERIRKRAESINSDSLSDRLEYDGPPDELYRLTLTLNDLLSRIQQSFEKMKRFTADASHELRIPLTGIRGTLEVALRKDRTPAEYQEFIQHAYQESERLSELVWDLLSLARADSNALKMDLKPVDLNSFLKDVFDSAEHLIVDQPVKIILGPVPEGPVVFDEAKIHQVLMNLLDNAIKYNKEGGEVLLSANLTPTELLVSVKDTGPGISDEDQLKVFDRFFRVDKSRSRELGGNGLGLSIAFGIAKAHNGNLSVRSVLGVGTEFILTLPILNNY